LNFNLAANIPINSHFNPGNAKRTGKITFASGDQGGFFEKPPRVASEPPEKLLFSMQLQWVQASM